MKIKMEIFYKLACEMGFDLSFHTFDCRADPAGGSQSRLILGMFTVFPAIGSVPPGGQQAVQVECLAESQGKCEEVIIFDCISFPIFLVNCSQMKQFLKHKLCLTDDH